MLGDAAMQVLGDAAVLCASCLLQACSTLAMKPGLLGEMFARSLAARPWHRASLASMRQ
jgi:hypothetical protein